LPGEYATPVCLPEGPSRPEKLGVEVTYRRKAITEKLRGHALSVSAVGEITRRREEQLEQFGSRGPESEA